jgi:hypothetical protein
MEPQEFAFDDGAVIVGDRVVEAFFAMYDDSLRTHVRMLGFEAYPPDKHGEMELRVGQLVAGSVQARTYLHTTDQAVRDACAIALEAARQRGLTP